jgi:hypothetical protein
MDTTDASRNVRDRRPKGNRWVFYFLVLGAMGVAAVVAPIVYNLSLQLQPEAVARARMLWEEHGPRDYDLELLQRRDQEENADEYFIKVRGGRVTSVIGKTEGVLVVDETALLALGPGIRALPPPEKMPPCTVEEMFDRIEEGLQHDAASAGKRNYATASFDSRDGHPHRYVHRVAGTKQRLEWVIKLTPRSDVTP